jgi:hypothetical protein
MFAITVALGGCGTVATATPTTGAVEPTTAVTTASPIGSASPESSREASVSPSSGSSAVVAPAGASDDGSPSPEVSASPVGLVPPAPGAAHRFGCHALLSDRQVSASTTVTSVLFVLPPGVKGPTPAKGETVCKWIGQKADKKAFDVLTTDVYVLTDGARSQFDATWAQYRESSFVVSVGGIGDDAAYLAQADSLFGFKGAVAFEVTLEPYPLSMYTPAAAKAAALAIARIVVAHL